MYEMLVKPKEKYDIMHKDMPVQKKSDSKYEPLGYTQCVPRESRPDHYLPQNPKSKEVVLENSSGDNGVIQMWQIVDKSYETQKDFNYRKGTENDFKNKLYSAMPMAQNRLKDFVTAASQDNDNNIKVLAQYAEEAYNVLTKDALKIYPMRGSSYGKAAARIDAISINVNMVLSNSVDNTAKTLIHEAFHIIGGCTTGKEVSCTSKDTNEMLNEMKNSTLEAINADTFAQFIMIY